MSQPTKQKWILRVLLGNGLRIGSPYILQWASESIYASIIYIY